MPTADVNGHELYYEQRGEGEPLLLIMGMSGTHLSWGDAFVDGLARDFTVTVYDHRGVGRSARAEAGYAIADLADDAAGLLDALGLEDAHVLGISMGGMVAQELALRHPERVRTLALGCTYSGGEGASLAPPSTVQRLQGALTSGDREQALRAGWELNVSERFAADDAAYAAHRDRALALPVPVPVIFAQMQAITGHDTSGRLTAIGAPTLVVHGTEDAMLPVANGRLIASRVPDARLEILEGVGHMFWIEQPERSAELVRDHALATARS
jgi:pimeloyl-ACP methyl ester carboxylesterase